MKVDKEIIGVDGIEDRVGILRPTAPFVLDYHANARVLTRETLAVALVP